MSEHNHTGLDEAASVASNTMQAVRTGKAISAAAKGAAAGGPYGAAIGAALSARKHIGKIAAAALVLLALPLLFILLLPGLAFGSLTDSGASGTSGQPILNDNAAITENMNQAAFAINQILGEGIENVKERIASDYAGTDGDHYEIINPYEGNPINNTNLFISQYCAAKELDFASIALADMEQILRAGLTHLYSFSRTREVRTIPAEEDGADDTTEIWYIYTIRYNGEAYFADTIFALTDMTSSMSISSLLRCQQKQGWSWLQPMISIIHMQMMQMHMIYFCVYRQVKKLLMRIECVMMADSIIVNRRKRWQHYFHMHLRQSKIHIRLHKDAMLRLNLV